MAYEITIRKTENSRISSLDVENIGFGKIFADHMFVVDYDGKTWTDARIEPYGNMELSPATSALHYGQSIFEGMKAFAANGEVQLFRPIENWKRLNISARRMVMPEIPQDLFMQGLNTLLDLDRAWVPAADGCSLYIRPFLFATDDFVGVRPSEKYRFCIFCCPVGPYYSKPLRVKVEEDYSRSAPGGTGYTKCAGNYGASMFPTKKAQQEGYDQVLWTDPVTHKFVEETGTTNFFAVFHDKIVTPELDETLLAGITRNSVIHILKHLGHTVEERKLSVQELKDALQAGELKELFITGTAATMIYLEGFGHHGTYYDVIANGNHTISNQVKDLMESIRYGRGADLFQWMTRVEAMNEVPA
ncbi:MAG: branched-chain amino acid aminotransferase [Bacteroidetes bacterium]|nr:branched-chain amino acid aminotransferase [Bacteroidota bacterium]